MSELPHYPQIRESVRINGQILPVYMYLGAILDGALRHQALLECGREVRYRHLATEEEAAQLLWSLHPRRAVVMFGRGRPLIQLAALFAAPPRAVNRILKELAPAPEKKYRRRDYTKRLTVRLDVDVQRTILGYCSECRADQQEVIAAAVRAAAPARIKDELRKLRSVKKTRPLRRKKA